MFVLQYQFQFSITMPVKQKPLSIINLILVRSAIKYFPCKALAKNTNQKEMPDPNFAVKHSELPQQNISEIISEIKEITYLI